MNNNMMLKTETGSSFQQRYVGKIAVLPVWLHCCGFLTLALCLMYAAVCAATCFSHGKRGESS